MVGKPVGLGDRVRVLCYQWAVDEKSFLGFGEEKMHHVAWLGLLCIGNDFVGLSPFMEVTSVLHLGHNCFTSSLYALYIGNRSESPLKCRRSFWR